MSPSTLFAAAVQRRTVIVSALKTIVRPHNEVDRSLTVSIFHATITIKVLKYATAKYNDNAGDEFEFAPGISGPTRRI